MVSTTDFHDARMTLKAATDLYGPNSTEYLTVDKAWAAVNVTLAEHPGRAPLSGALRPTRSGHPVQRGARLSQLQGPLLRAFCFRPSASGLLLQALRFTRATSRSSPISRPCGSRRGSASYEVIAPVRITAWKGSPGRPRRPPASRAPPRSRRTRAPDGTTRTTGRSTPRRPRRPREERTARCVRGRAVGVGQLAPVDRRHTGDGARRHRRGWIRCQPPRLTRHLKATETSQSTCGRFLSLLLTAENNHLGFRPCGPPLPSRRSRPHAGRFADLHDGSVPRPPHPAEVARRPGCLGRGHQGGPPADGGGYLVEAPTRGAPRSRPAREPGPRRRGRALFIGVKVTGGELIGPC